MCGYKIEMGYISSQHSVGSQGKAHRGYTQQVGLLSLKPHFLSASASASDHISPFSSGWLPEGNQGGQVRGWGFRGKVPKDIDRSGVLYYSPLTVPVVGVMGTEYKDYKRMWGAPWWSSGYHSVFPVQGVHVQSLVWEVPHVIRWGQKIKIINK